MQRLGVVQTALRSNATFENKLIIFTLEEWRLHLRTLVLQQLRLPSVIADRVVRNPSVNDERRAIFAFQHIGKRQEGLSRTPPHDGMVLHSLRLPVLSRQHSRIARIVGDSL